MSIQVPYQKLPGGLTPVYKNKGDAGADIYNKEPIFVAPGQTILVGTGLKVAIPEGYFIDMRPRSGISAKTMLRLANSPGTIDSGYRDEMGIIIQNLGFSNVWVDFVITIDGKIERYENSMFLFPTYLIPAGTRLAQILLLKVEKMDFVEVDDVGVIGENRGGGFGSTGLFEHIENKEDKHEGKVEFIELSDSIDIKDN